MIIEFEKEKHLSLINGWALERGLEIAPESIVPKIGWVSLIKEIPVAAVFVYQTDSSICFIENLISSKQSSKEDRLEAIRELFDAPKLDHRTKGKSFFAYAPNVDSITEALNFSGYGKSTLELTLHIYRGEI